MTLPSTPTLDAIVAETAALKAAAEAGGGSGGGGGDGGVDPAKWRLVFEDTFPTNVPFGQFPQAVSAKWGAYPTSYDDTSNNGIYDAARTIKIENGEMTVRMHTTSDGIHRVACPVPYIKPPTSTMKWPGQLYGRYMIRAKFPSVMPGYKVAWLLWPDKGTNTSGSPSGVGGNGEIDFPEHDLKQQGHTSAFMHRQDATAGNDQYQCGTDLDLRQYHEFVTEWSKDLCVFFVDGREIGRTIERVPNTSMHWVIQCETQLSGGEPADNVVGDIVISDVMVWAKT